jgi:hypothetical protein
MRRKPAATGDPIPRRAVLIGVAALAGGAAVGALSGRHTVSGTGSPEAPSELISARDAEQGLIDAIDAMIASNPGTKATLLAIRADHQAHHGALAAAIAAYPASATVSKPTPVGARSVPALIAAERAAAQAAARRAALLLGPNAALLASIAACEASHAAALS